MAKKQQNPDLIQTLRGSGIRKKVARSLADAAEKTSGGKQPKVLTRAIDDLRNAASQLEDRMTSKSRTEAANKAARTRKRKAAQRRATARKAARTRTGAA